MDTVLSSSHTLTFSVIIAAATSPFFLLILCGFFDQERWKYCRLYLTISKIWDWSNGSGGKLHPDVECIQNIISVQFQWDSSAKVCRVWE